MMFFKYPKLRWCKCKCKWWRWWWCGCCCCESGCCKTTLCDLFGDENRVSSILVVELLLISTRRVEFGCMLIMPLVIMAASLPVWWCCWFEKNSFTLVKDFDGLRACDDLLDADFVDESARCDDDVDVELWLSTVFERLIIKPAVERLKAWMRLDAERLTPDVSASIVSPYFVFLLVAIKRCRRHSSHSVCDTISFF